MAISTTASIENEFSREPSFGPVLFISIAFHAFVFVGIPLLTMLFYHPVKYQRPPTFQLVSMKAPHTLVQPKRTLPKVEAAKPLPKKLTTPIPQKHKSKPVAKPQAKPEENTNDLSELLSSIPSTPVSEIASAQNFKYNWYIQNVQSRVEDNWKPPGGLTEKNDVFVIVSFTIFVDGNISKIAISQSSGITTLDNIAIKAIQTSAPFGKLPIGFADNKLDLTYTLHYDK